MPSWPDDDPVTYMRVGSSGSIATASTRVSGEPLSTETPAHVSPPSVVLNSPLYSVPA